MMTATLRVGVRGAAAGRVRAALDGGQVQRPQEIAIDQLQRHARLARRADRVGVAERLLQPGAPVVGAARRAHAAAAVVVQHGVVGAEHRLVEERLQRQLAIAVRDDVEDVAVEEELGDRSRSEQVAHLGGPGGERHVGVAIGQFSSRARVCAASGGGSEIRSSMAPIVFC